MDNKAKLYYRLRCVLKERGIKMVQFNSNQVFVVTGATSGIGEAVAIDINARGGGSCWYW